MNCDLVERESNRVSQSGSCIVIINDLTDMHYANYHSCARNAGAAGETFSVRTH